MFIIVHFTAPGDYSTKFELLTFTPTKTQFSFSVTIMDDDVVESTEAFTVRVELVTMDAPGVSITHDQSTVTISDKDRKQL